MVSLNAVRATERGDFPSAVVSPLPTHADISPPGVAAGDDPRVALSKSAVRSGRHVSPFAGCNAGWFYSNNRRLGGESRVNGSKNKVFSAGVDAS